MKKLLILAALFIGVNAFAQTKHTVVKSAVTYHIKNMGINTDGKFESVQANINFDTQHLAASSIEATADAASINSDNNMRDNHLRKPDYFDVEKYPKITMKSVSFKSNGGNNYTGIFNVTIKDKTKAVEVPFTYTENGSSALFKGSFKINRRDFGVGGKSLILSDEATVNVEVQTNK
ncbi:YceI family protein [Mucilaginibacter sp. RS28]|uniref:YceI family protein n=1 Tax=Mucilaginibacter straminoryzae TaxID=2932774 RepID=A0A9X1X3E9_9SPHI|nr:YceI family protein [Mucilaginibacter straminoryzae]MCJ8210472.1 YceI family protein [Mucilaginibacter straminoryzae]